MNPMFDAKLIQIVVAVLVSFFGAVFGAAWALLKYLNKRNEEIAAANARVQNERVQLARERLAEALRERDEALERVRAQKDELKAMADELRDERQKHKVLLERASAQITLLTEELSRPRNTRHHRFWPPTPLPSLGERNERCD